MGLRRILIDMNVWLPQVCSGDIATAPQAWRSNLPKDAKILAVREVLDKLAVVDILIESKEWEETKAGDYIPDFRINVTHYFGDAALKIREVEQDGR